MMLVEGAKLVNNRKKQAVVYGYAFGALDAVAQLNKTNYEDTLVAAIHLFVEFFGMSPDDAGRTTRLCMELTKDPQWSPYIREGGQAILDWASNRDEHAPIRLFELLQDLDANKQG